jgi:hypothetical protein
MGNTRFAWVLGFALVFCCALPFLLLTGVLAVGGGLVFSQQLLAILGVAIVIFASLVFLLTRLRGR